MGSKPTEILKRRSYDEAFKKTLVTAFESGKFSVLQLEKMYGVSNQLIYRWIYKYSRFNEKGCRVVEMKDSHLNKLKELENKVKELEQMVGRKQIHIEYLEKMIELAGEELKTDIKKNFSSPPSAGSVKTGSG